MKTFEKIYWTLATISGFLLVAGMVEVFVDGRRTLRKVFCEDFN